MIIKYRHAKQAGNFGDVLKHSLHVQLLNLLNQQSQKTVYLESHAGPAVYSLQHGSNAKYLNGIAKFLQCDYQNQDLPSCFTPYLNLVKKLNQTDALNTYPGSPYFAQQILSKHSHNSKSTEKNTRRLEGINSALILYEWQYEIYNQLLTNTQQDSRVHCINEDGFKGVLQHNITPNQQVYLLIDPPYEQDIEYQHAIHSLSQFHKRHPHAIIALWYPIISEQQLKLFEQSLMATGVKEITLYEIRVSSDLNLYKKNAMVGAGMAIVNAPNGFHVEIKDALPILATCLGEQVHTKTNRGSSRCLRLGERHEEKTDYKDR